MSKAVHGRHLTQRRHANLTPTEIDRVEHRDFSDQIVALIDSPDFRQSESVSGKFRFTNLGDSGTKKGLKFSLLPLSASFGAPIAFGGSVIPGASKRT